MLKAKPRVEQGHVSRLHLQRGGAAEPSHGGRDGEPGHRGHGELRARS